MKLAKKLASVAAASMSTLLLGACPQSTSAAPATYVVPLGSNAVLPSIVVPFNAEKKTGFEWSRLQKLSITEAEADPEGEVFLAVRYLREGIARMTGSELPVENTEDMSSGIVLTTLALASPGIQKDTAVQKALERSGEDEYNANEAYYVRTDAKRVLIVANTPAGLCHGAVALLESAGYEVLGMGPNWVHVPDLHGKRLGFSTEQSGRPGFYIRDLGAASGQSFGIGTIKDGTLADASDETVVESYNRWRIGTGLAGRSMSKFLGHSWQKYHRQVADKMWDLKTTEGFLTKNTTLGPDTQRPVATPENQSDIWIDSDPKMPVNGGVTPHARVFVSDGKKWNEYDMMSTSGGAKLDVSVPFVREIILDDFKAKAAAHFEQELVSPLDRIFTFGTDPEDESKPIEWMRHKNWYPEYLKSAGVAFGQPYKLNNFRGLQQPREIWDPAAKSDTVFALNNWLLREFDKGIDSLPQVQRLADGQPKKDMVRTSLLSYNEHDVPPNFNLDPRIRVMIAGYPKHRGFDKWKNFATAADMAMAFRVLLPREPSADYWILSLSAYRDQETRDIGGSLLPRSIRKRLCTNYDAGFRALYAEMDFNFGKQGLEYYLYSKLLWNPNLSVAELDGLRDRWLQRAFGPGWAEMKAYYDFMAPENYTVNAPNVWAKAIRLIDAAGRKMPPGTAAHKRLDDVKQFWYFYYLVDSGQDTAASPEMKEFLWKGQMSYMTAMHAVATRVFKNYRVRQIVGEELSRGPAHYSAAETAEWWKKILNYWPLVPVNSFADAALVNGIHGRDVDLKDLVAVAQFQSKEADSPFFYNSAGQKNASVLAVARKAGQEIGFKLFWPYNPNDNNYRDKRVAYGINRWDAVDKDWIEMVDATSSAQQSVEEKDKNGKPQQVVEVRYRVQQPGTYRMDVGDAGLLASLTTLNYDVATGAYTLSQGLSYGFTFHDTQDGLTQSQTYIYVPKGTKSLDLEVWRPGGKRSLSLYTGLPSEGPILKRTVDISTKGTHTIALQPGEDGSVAVLQSDGFYFPLLYSVPLLWAKSPRALLVPRAIADADGLVPLR